MHDYACTYLYVRVYAYMHIYFPHYNEKCEKCEKCENVKQVQGLSLLL